MNAPQSDPCHRGSEARTRENGHPLDRQRVFVDIVGVGCCPAPGVAWADFVRLEGVGDFCSRPVIRRVPSLANPDPELA
jgi:hypothetical protein